jgi:hypothetical protein
MKSIPEQIDNLTNEYNLKLEKLKTKLEAEKKQDFEVIKYKNKEFRIYKWEDKQIKDFKIPNGFDFAEFNDFLELYDNKKVELEVYKYYYVKHFSKIQQTKEYCLSGLCLGWGLNLGSDNDNLADSDSDGRVVVSRIIKDKKVKNV